MENRLRLSKGYLNEKFVHLVAIDEVEQRYLGDLLSGNICLENNTVCLTVISNRRGQQGKNLSSVHEYMYVTFPDDKHKYIGNTNFDKIDHRVLRDSGTESLRTDAKNCFYPIIVKNNEIIGFGNVPEDDFHPIDSNELQDDGTILIWPIDTKGSERKWRYARQTVEEIWSSLEVVVTKATKKKKKNWLKNLIRILKIQKPKYKKQNKMLWVILKN